MTWQKYPVAALTFATFFFTACGDDSKTASNSINGSDEGIVAISDKTISGVTQKGPFVNGSSVTVQELDGETLAQTGSSFEGKIKNDMGEFSVKVKSLESQYALLKANGYYRNEVTGNKSKSQITLYALTDLSNRDQVNINLLTHLAYERTLYLATEEGLSVTEAKKQAESEVLKSFGIEGDFAAAEDLNIFGESDQNAALLAISILMQGNLSEADFSERLANYAADIETDGVWNDSKTATKIADWANAQWLSSKFVKIRENITKWELSADVPAFEKYVNNFWWQNYGLGTCNTKREGEVLKNQNTASTKINEYYICKSGSWQIASDIEKDTYNWLDPTAKRTEKDGDVRYGDVVTTNCYVYEDKTWRRGNTNDCSLGLRGCTALRQDTVSKGSNNVWYICDSKTWHKASNIEKDTATWNAGLFDGEIRKGQVNKNIYYLYESKTNAWREAISIEIDTYDYEKNEDWATGKDGEIKKGSVTEQIYVYDSTEWREADEIESTLGGCVAANEDSVGVVGESYYICSSRKWIEATELQYVVSENSCDNYGKIVHGKINQDYAYFCNEKEWIKFYGNDSISYGKLVDERDKRIYRTVETENQVWMAENLNYNIDGSICYGDDEANCAKYGRLYKWALAKEVCPAGWHLPTTADFEILLMSMGGKTVAGKKLKSANGWSDRGNGTDVLGFSAFPAGHNGKHPQEYSGILENTAFWSVADKDGAYVYFMHYNDDGVKVVKGYDYDDYAFSVRCVKDEE